MELEFYLDMEGLFIYVWIPFTLHILVNQMVISSGVYVLWQQKTSRPLQNND
jgi:hypothetical protein